MPARMAAGVLLAGLACAAAAAGGPGPDTETGRPAIAPAPSESTAPRSAAVGLDQDAAFALSRSVIGSVPGDYVMLDRDGRERALAQFRGKPLLVNFVYSGCFEVCPTSTRALAAAVQAMSTRFGADQFNVVSIGFDQPTDSPVSLRAFAARQRINAANWQFLSPRGGDVATLARDFGFSFAATPIGFDHTLQVSILDADGRIYRQVYGDGFAADSLGEPLKQLIAGTLFADTRSWGDLLGRVRILCSVYDPESGTYRLDYTLFIEIAGGVTFILAMLWFTLAEWRMRRQARRSALAAAGPSGA
jgi:protein SCO1